MGYKNFIGGATVLYNRANNGTKRRRSVSSVSYRPGKKIRTSPRRKITRSFTRTMTRRKSDTITRSPTSGISHSRFTAKYIKSKIPYGMLKTIPVFHYRENSSGTLLCLVDRQNAEIVKTIGGADRLKVLSFDATAGQLAGAVSSQLNDAAGYRSIKTCVLNVGSTTSFTNCGTECITMDIYEISPKIDQLTAGKDPLNAWNETGIDDHAADALAGGTAPYTKWYQYMFTTPKQSNTFNHNYKVLKKTTVELGPGRSHEHVSRYIGPKIFDTTYAQDNLILRQFTRFIMIVVRSVALDDANTFAAGGVCFGQCKVVYKTVTTYTIKNFTRSQRRINYNNNGIDTGLIPYTMNEGDGDIEFPKWQ